MDNRTTRAQEKASLEDFHNALVSAKRKLLRTEIPTLNVADGLSDHEADEGSAACLRFLEGMSFELRNRQGARLQRINSALLRIANGTFGRCESCNETIDRERLKALPIAELCASCKETKEHDERNTAKPKPITVAHFYGLTVRDLVPLAPGLFAGNF